MRVTSKDGRVQVELEDLGEGVEGEYRGPKVDIPLLRFTVYLRAGRSWTELEDSSYCTQIPADLPKKEQRRLAKIILAEVEEPARDHGRIKKLCERLSWINPTWGTKEEKRCWMLDAMMAERGI